MLLSLKKHNLFFLSAWLLLLCSSQQLRGADATTKALTVTIQLSEKDPHPIQLSLPKGLGKNLKNLKKALTNFAQKHQIPPILLENLSLYPPSPSKAMPQLYEFSKIKIQGTTLKLFIVSETIEKIKINTLIEHPAFQEYTRQIEIDCPCFIHQAEVTAGNAYGKSKKIKVVNNNVLLHLIVKKFNLQIQKKIQKKELLPPYILSTIKEFIEFRINQDDLCIIPKNKEVTIAFRPMLSLTHYGSPTEYIPLKTLQPTKLKDYLQCLPERHKARKFFRLSLSKRDRFFGKRSTQIEETTSLSPNLMLPLSFSNIFNQKELPLHFFNQLILSPSPLNKGMPPIVFEGIDYIDKTPNTVEETKTLLIKNKIFPNKGWLHIYNGKKVMEDHQKILYLPPLFTANHQFTYALTVRIYLFGEKPMSVQLPGGLGVNAFLEPLQNVLDQWSVTHHKPKRQSQNLFLHQPLRNATTPLKELLKEDEVIDFLVEYHFLDKVANKKFPHLGKLALQGHLPKNITLKTLKLLLYEKDHKSLQERIIKELLFYEKNLVRALKMNAPQAFNTICTLLSLPSQEKLNTLQGVSNPQKVVELSKICQTVIPTIKQVNQRNLEKLELLKNQLEKLQAHQFKKDELIRLAQEAQKINEEALLKIRETYMRWRELINSYTGAPLYAKQFENNPTLFSLMSGLTFNSPLAEIISLKALLQEENPNLKRLEKLIENAKIRELITFISSHRKLIQKVGLHSNLNVEKIETIEELEIYPAYLKWFIDQVTLQNKEVSTQQNGWIPNAKIIKANRWNPLKEAFLAFLDSDYFRENFLVLLNEEEAEDFGNNINTYLETDKEKHQMMKAVISFIQEKKIYEKIKKAADKKRRIKIKYLQKEFVAFKNYIQVKNRELDQTQAQLNQKKTVSLKLLEEIANDAHQIREEELSAIIQQKEHQVKANLLRVSKINQKDTFVQLKETLNSNDEKALKSIAQKTKCIEVLGEASIFNDLSEHPTILRKRIHFITQKKQNRSLVKKAHLQKFVDFNDCIKSFSDLSHAELEKINAFIQENKTKESIALLKAAQMRAHLNLVKKDIEKIINLTCEEPTEGEVLLYDQKMKAHIDQQKKTFRSASEEKNKHKITFLEIGQNKCFLGKKDHLKVSLSLQKAAQKNSLKTPMGDFAWSRYFDKETFLYDKKNEIFDPQGRLQSIYLQQASFVVEPRWLFLAPRSLILDTLFISAEDPNPTFKVNAAHNCLLILSNLQDKSVNYYPFTSEKENWQSYLAQLHGGYPEDALFMVENQQLIPLNRDRNIKNILYFNQLHLFVTSQKKKARIAPHPNLPNEDLLVGKNESQTQKIAQTFNNLDVDESKENNEYEAPLQVDKKLQKHFKNKKENIIIPPKPKKPLADDLDPKHGIRLTIKRIGGDEEEAQQKILEENFLTENALKKLIPLEKNYYYAFYYSLQDDEALKELFFKQGENTLSSKILNNATLYYKKMAEPDPQEKNPPTIYNAQWQAVNFKKVTITLITPKKQLTKILKREEDMIFTRQGLQALTQKAFKISTYTAAKYFHFTNLDDLVKENQLEQQNENYMLREDIALNVHYGTPVGIYAAFANFKVPPQLIYIPAALQTQQQANGYLQKEYPHYTLYYQPNLAKEIYLPLTAMEKPEENKSLCTTYYKNKDSFICLQNEEKKTKINIGNLENANLEGISDKIMTYFSKYGDQKAYWKLKKDMGAKVHFKDESGNIITNLKESSLLTLPQVLSYEVGFQIALQEIDASDEEKQVKVVAQEKLDKELVKALFPLQEDCYYAFFYIPKESKTKRLKNLTLDALPQMQALENTTLFYKAFKAVDQSPFWKKYNNLPTMYNHELESVTFQKITIRNKKKRYKAIYKEGIEGEDLYKISGVNFAEEGLYYKEEFTDSYRPVYPKEPLSATLPPTLEVYDHTEPKIQESIQNKIVTIHIPIGYTFFEKLTYWIFWGKFDPFKKNFKKEIFLSFPEYVITQEGEIKYDQFLDQLENKEQIPSQIRNDLANVEVIVKESDDEIFKDFTPEKTNDAMHPKLHNYIEECNRNVAHKQRKRMPLKKLHQIKAGSADVYLLPNEAQRNEKLEKNYLVSAFFWGTLIAMGAIFVRSKSKSRLSKQIRKKILQKERPKKRELPLRRKRTPRRKIPLKEEETKPSQAKNETEENLWIPPS